MSSHQLFVRVRWGLGVLVMAVNQLNRGDQFYLYAQKEKRRTRENGVLHPLLISEIKAPVINFRLSKSTAMQLYISLHASSVWALIGQKRVFKI